MIGVTRIVQLARERRIARQLQLERLNTALDELIRLSERAPEEWSDVDYARYIELQTIVRSN